ncbi:hypothetical protein BDF19DRAFT_89477 [Syncephalis fuscata]|nr:hypothetical protein BDF19DRAFT_89477 [Syncephalis fuscata]
MATASTSSASSSADAAKTTEVVAAAEPTKTDEVYEMVLLQLPECFVYRLPPRTRSGGYRAEEWGLDNPMWTGRIRIIGQGEQCFIRLEDPKTEELFAAGPYASDGRAVEVALDSSRYFVLRVEDAGRRAFIGIGFRERNDAFDFNATLQSYLRHRRAIEDRASGKASVSNTPSINYQLKEGEVIHLALNGMPTTKASNRVNATLNV